VIKSDAMSAESLLLKVGGGGSALDGRKNESEATVGNESEEWRARDAITHPG
jgi:hypothetical protein